MQFSAKSQFWTPPNHQYSIRFNGGRRRGTQKGAKKHFLRQNVFLELKSGNYHKFTHFHDFCTFVLLWHPPRENVVFLVVYWWFWDQKSRNHTFCAPKPDLEPKSWKWVNFMKFLQKVDFGAFWAFSEKMLNSLTFLKWPRTDRQRTERRGPTPPSRRKFSARGRASRPPAPIFLMVFHVLEKMQIHVTKHCKP